VFNPQANAVAAVKVSGDTLAGVVSNWLVNEPPGAAANIVKDAGGTLPPGLSVTSGPDTLTGGPAGPSTAGPGTGTSTGPLAAVGGTISEMSTLLGDTARALDWFFHFFKPGQGWRILLGAGAVASGYGGVRAWMAAADTDDPTSALPLSVLLLGVAFLCAFMTLRQWPTTGGQPILPTAYAADIIAGQPPQAGTPPGSDADAIEAGLGALIALWGASKIASGLSGLGSLLGGLGGFLGGIATGAASTGEGE